MTVKELRTLVNNLDEYIRIPDGVTRLKNTILHLAVSGQLVPQDSADGLGEDLFQTIKDSKQAKKQKSFAKILEPRYDVPDSWKWVHLAEITDLITDGTHHTPKYQPQGVPFLSIKDVSGGMLDFSKTKFISEEEHAEINQRCNPEMGDILFCRIGTLGKPVVVDTDEPFSIFVSLGLIKFNQEYVLPEFLKLYLEAPDTYKQYRKIMAGGSHTNKLNLASMNFLEIVLPPVGEQRRIIDRLQETLQLVVELEIKYSAEQIARRKLTSSSLVKLVTEGNDLALQNFSEIIKTEHDVDVLESAVLSLAVRGKLLSQNSSEGTGEELYKEIQVEKARLNKEGKLNKRTTLDNSSSAESLFEIPKTWKWVSLADIGITQTGGTPKKNNSSLFGEDIPFIKPGDIYKDKVNYSNEGLSAKGLESLGRSASPGSILMVCIGTIGKCNVIDVLCAFNQQINSLSPYRCIDSRFVLFALRSPYFQKEAWSKSSSTTISILNKSKWESIAVPLPPIAEQRRITEKIDQVFKLTKSLRHDIVR